MEPDETPADPITELMEGAGQMHEAFTTFVESGFTEKQALYLVGQMLCASIRPNVPGEG